jgi:hypothetical protein
VEIRPATADHIIRWAQWRIPSTLALLAELSDIPEKTLRQLTSSDFDRVMLAMINVLPPLIKADWEQGQRPMATPEEELPEAERGVPPPDPLDPRFPAAEGPVRRLQSQPLPPTTTSPPEAETPPEMNMVPPSVIQPVH